MSRARVWAVVEGKNHDTPFYEGLLADGGGVAAVEFVRAEDIEVDGVAAGGKSHALKVFQALQGTGGLQQENKETKVDVLFFLDRDDDEYVGSLIEDDHIQYTHFADVEAEIVNQANLSAAISRAFSVSRTEAASHAPESPASDLASRWSEWIALRLASADCGWSDTRFAQPSGINVPRYGSVDVARTGPICKRVQDECPGWDEALERARGHVSSASEAGESARLVKGKWLPPFIVHLVVQSFGRERSLPSVDSAHLLTACLTTIDFSAVWARRYANRLAPVLNR
jgi:hypothetical protein